MELPAQPELEPGWREIRAELRRVVGDSTYEIWLAGLNPKSWDGRRLVIEGPPATHAWVTRRFGRVLEAAARAVLGTPAKVDLEPTGRDVSGRARPIKRDWMSSGTQARAGGTVLAEPAAGSGAPASEAR